MSLLEEQLEEIKNKTAAVGVTPEMANASPVSAGLLGIEPPKHWTEKAFEEDGKMKFFGKMLLGGFTGLTPFLFPEMIGSRDRYKAELEQYQDAKARLSDLNQMQADIATLSDGVEGPEDALARARLLSTDALNTVEKVNFALGNDPKLDKKYETKFDNGVLVRYDVNNPSDVMVMKDPQGNPITEKADGDVRKTAGWFRRAVPALENMHKLEDRGVTLPREALLLTQQAQGADGFFDKQLYDRLLNDLALTSDQKQYLRNAQDLAMIQLRKESGAAIGVQEMFNELNQNVMLSPKDMDDEAYQYQRIARANKYRQLGSEMTQPLIDAFAEEGLYSTLDRLRANSARVRQDAGGLAASTDPVGDFFDFSDSSEEDFDPIYEALPDGTSYVGPDGQVRIKGRR